MNKQHRSSRFVLLVAAPILGVAVVSLGSVALADGTPKAEWQRGATLTGSPDGDAVPAPAAPRPTRADMEALQEVNRLRAQHGLGPISFEPRLFAAAYSHSLEQLQGNYLGHDSRRPGGATLGQRMNAEGYYGRMYAEVVARDYIDARSVVQAWMDSPRHREVLLDPDLSQGAFARVDGSIAGLNRWTGEFSAPVAQQTPTPPPAPKPAAPSASPSRVSLPSTNVPRSNAGYAQPQVPQPTARAAAPTTSAAMPTVPAPAPRVLAGSSGSTPVAPRVAAAPPPPADPAAAPLTTQPRVTAPLPQAPRVVASPPPPSAPVRVAAPTPSRAPLVAAAPSPSQPYRPPPTPRRTPRRVGACAT